MNELMHNDAIQKTGKIVSGLIILVASYIALAFFKADVPALFVILLFFLFYVLIPGLYLFSKLDIRKEHISTNIALSFFTGFCLEVLLYFFSNLLATNLLLWIVGPVLSILFIVERFQNNGKDFLESYMQHIHNLPTSFYLFVALVFLYSMIMTQYTYISPRYADYSSMKIDFAYHAGIINALSHGFPPIDPWISDRTIEYHLFTEMLYCIPVRLIGVHSEDILMSCTPYIITPIFSVSLYSFFKEFAVHKENAGLYCIVTHFSCMFMIRQWANSYFLFHIYSNINNTGMSLSCLLVILTLLKTWDRKEKENKMRTNTKEIALLGFLVMLETGIKGPVSIVLAAAMIGTVILGLCLRAIDKELVAVAGMACIGFIVVYVYILGAQHSNETGGRLLNLWEVTDTFFLKEFIMESLGGPTVLKHGVLFIAFMIFYFSAFLIPFIIGYIRELFLVITKKKDFIFSEVVIYAACLVGTIAMMVFNFSGHSQVYFGFTSLILVPLISFWFIEEVFYHKTKVIKGVKAAFFLSMVITTLTNYQYLYNGIQNARDTYLRRNEDSGTYRNISAKEYEGMEWLRKNTDKDSLIASDRYNSVSLDEYDVKNRGHNTHFAYAVYSNRRQYIEGAGFSLEDNDSSLRAEKVWKNNQLYDPDNNNRGQLAKELGVDYLVVSKRFNKTEDLSNDNYEKCFSNGEMDIYRIK